MLNVSYPKVIKPEMERKSANHSAGLSPRGDVTNFTGAESLAAKIPESILKSPKLHSFLKFSERNASLFEASVLLGLGTTLRPATIIAMPGAKMEDRQYAAAKSIATGIIGFLVACAIYIPLSRGMEKAGKAALKAASQAGIKGFPAIGSKEYDAFNYLINYGSKFIIGPLDALLLFKLIPPIMKRVFPHKNAKKDNVNPLPVMAAKLNDDQQRVFDMLMQKSTGGVR